MRRDGTPEDLLNRPGALAIVLVLVHRGPQERQGLEDQVGVQGGTIRYHVLALETAGLVVQDGQPIQIRLRDAASTRRMLEKAYPGWESGGIPRGWLWRQAQAAIDTRRIRGANANRVPLPRRPSPGRP